MSIKKNSVGIMVRWLLVIIGLMVVGECMAKPVTSKNTLATYRKKRNFKKTSEPSGVKKKVAKKSQDKIFVIHKHNASHLHYDVRIEVGGVLKSWAVPKGVPKKISEKHLAIQTEDHPYDYAKFHGTIPEGNYGAGTVEIWDSGTYRNIKTHDGKLVPMKECLTRGTVEIFMSGKKLHGPYALIRTNFRGKPSWLMIKMKYRNADRTPVKKIKS